MPERSASSGRTATPPATAWCRCRSRCPLPHGKRAEGAALQLAHKMGIEPAMVVHAKAMGPDFTFFVVYGSVQHLVDLDEVAGRGARLPAARRRRRSTPPSRTGCAASSSSSAPASAPTRTRSASTRSSTSRASRGRRAWSTTARSGREPRRPGDRARAGRAGPRGAGRRRPRLPGRHPEGRAPAQHPRAGRRVPRGDPGGAAGRCWSSAARASTRPWPPSSASTRSSAGGRRPARSRSYLVHRWPRPGREGSQHDRRHPARA